jgi:hypothetical protein
MPTNSRTRLRERGTGRLLPVEGEEGESSELVGMLNAPIYSIRKNFIVWKISVK